MGFVVTTLVVWDAQPATKVATTMPYHAATMLKRESLRRDLLIQNTIIPETALSVCRESLTIYVGKV